MTLTEFLERVVDEGIVAAKESYPEGTFKRMGAIAGFEACRGKKTAQELGELLREATEKREVAFREERNHYWYYATYYNEIEWTCNVVSAVLQNQGLPTIVTPTTRGFVKAASIVGVAGAVRA